MKPKNETRSTRLEPLLSKEAIEEKIAQVGVVLNRDYSGREITLIMVMKGAVCLVADLIRHIRLPLSLEFVQAASYGQRGKARGELNIFGLETLDIASKDVLVVDDIYDSGNTLCGILERLKEKNPASLKSLVLLSKKIERETSYVPDYVLFEIENLFVVGYGLDYKEYYRGLSGIYVLHQE